MKGAKTAWIQHKNVSRSLPKSSITIIINTNNTKIIRKTTILEKSHNQAIFTNYTKEKSGTLNPQNCQYYTELTNESMSKSMSKYQSKIYNYNRQ